MGSQFPNQGLNPGHSSERPESEQPGHQRAPVSIIFTKLSALDTLILFRTPNPSLESFASETSPLCRGNSWWKVFAHYCG